MWSRWDNIIKTAIITLSIETRVSCHVVQMKCQSGPRKISGASTEGYKFKMCKFYVVQGNGKASLGMPDIDMLNIIKRNCKTIGTHRNDSANNCSTITAICQSQNMCNTAET